MCVSWDKLCFCRIFAPSQQNVVSDSELERTKNVDGLWVPVGQPGKLLYRISGINDGWVSLTYLTCCIIRYMESRFPASYCLH